MINSGSIPGLGSENKLYLEKTMKTKQLNLENFKYSLFERFMDLEPISTFREWTYRIIKIVQWIPILWNDWDWENSHILKILNYKLSRVEKALIEDPYHTDEKTGKRSGPILAKEVKEARDCIKRILENDYCKKEKKLHNKKYGKLDMILNEDDITYGKDGKPLSRGVTWINGGPAASRSLMKIYNLEEKRRKDDYKKLFDILTEKSERWWI